MIMIANLQYAWTLFVQPLQAGTGWKLSDIQFAFTLFILFQTWVQPLDGWLIDRLGPARFISAAGVLCGLGWAGMGYATSLPMLYALYCLAGIGAAFVYSGSIGSALKWFKDRRGLASGIMAAGFGGGTALFIPFISSMIATSGYQTAFVDHRHVAGPGDPRRRAVPAASAGRARQRQAPATAAAPQLGQPAVHHARDAAHAAVLRDVRDVRADGHRRPAGDRQRRADGQVVGPLRRRADAGRDAQPARQRRQPRLLGLGVGPARPRERR